MAEGLPPIQMDTAADRAPVVIVGEAEVRAPADLAAAAPGLLDPKFAKAYAQLVNHLARGFQYSVILDPEAYREGYLAALAERTPREEPPRPGEQRFGDFGVPDFEAIHAPAFEDGTLVFFAQQEFLGVPYRVEMPRDGEPRYAPVPMTAE